MSWDLIRPVLPFSREAAGRSETDGPRVAAPLAGRSGPASAPSHILLLGDEPAALAELLRGAFPAPGHRVVVAGPGLGGLGDVRGDSPDVVVLGPGGGAAGRLEMVRQIRQVNASVPVLFVTGARRADEAIQAIRQGAFDCLFGPLDPGELRRVVGEALEVARQMQAPAVPAEAVPEPVGDGELVGACPAMQEVYKAIGRVAAQDVPVLITGESGTGKELVARAIRQHGRRSQAPFLALNCAAIPESLLESELFGHEKGAFSGAERRRIGKFEQVSGGTLFLDEIGDMPLALQAKVLRLLQEQAFERVGGNETIRTDVRLIAATHRDLKAASAEGKFRPDVYYRLGVFTIHLPPLRERGDDLPLLVRHYLRRFSGEMGREVREVAPEALERLGGYEWPGNVRELQSVLKQALLRASGTVLLPAFLPNLSGRRGEAGQSAPAGADLDLDGFIRRRLGPDERDLHASTHRQVDAVLLPLVLKHTGGNQLQAARLLGIARQTLRQKVRDLGLSVSCSGDADGDNSSGG
jgi:two-component system nitrogen regulation response regulator GlnG